MDWVRFRDGEEGCALARCGQIAGPADIRFAVRTEAEPRDANVHLPEQAEPVAVTWIRRGEYHETVLPQVVRHAVIKYAPPG